jgi:hypothetical protein
MTSDQEQTVQAIALALRELRAYLQTHQHSQAMGQMGQMGPPGPPGPPGLNLVGDPTIEVARMVVLRAAVEAIANCDHQPLADVASVCARCGAYRPTGVGPWEHRVLVSRLLQVWAAT